MGTVFGCMWGLGCAGREIPLDPLLSSLYGMSPWPVLQASSAQLEELGRREKGTD